MWSENPTSNCNAWGPNFVGRAHCFAVKIDQEITVCISPKVPIWMRAIMMISKTTPGGVRTRGRLVDNRSRDRLSCAFWTVDAVLCWGGAPPAMPHHVAKSHVARWESTTRPGVRSRPRACFVIICNFCNSFPLKVVDFGRIRVCNYL